MNDDARATLPDIAGRAAASEPAHAYIIENVPSFGAGLPAPHIVTPSNNSVVEGDVVTVGGHADPRVTVELFDWLDELAESSGWHLGQILEVDIRERVCHGAVLLGVLLIGAWCHIPQELEYGPFQWLHGPFPAQS